MGLSLFAIFKCELLHYHAELMSRGAPTPPGPSMGDTPAKAVQRPGAGSESGAADGGKVCSTTPADPGTRLCWKASAADPIHLMNFVERLGRRSRGAG